MLTGTARQIYGFVGILILCAAIYTIVSATYSIKCSNKCTNIESCKTNTILSGINIGVGVLLLFLAFYTCYSSWQWHPLWS